ncbi:hypothetical protein KIW84_031717 [Lathyrus oleraceus]|uniref:glucan endo-1,3-beta-D-glucosidase n=1 Tax=Pisum sativum TaxID=3888 RepID=A0A9D4XSH8_PEA|nr:hypothetical protein KIW84_031717 [Pisum sativum]
MLNAYPYYGYTKGNSIFPIEYALIRPLPSVKKIVDPNTLYHYNSMFDAMVDAAYYSIDALNFKDIPVVVTETGWPSFGGENEPDATAENAETYSNNMIQRVLNNSGPPNYEGQKQMQQLPQQQQQQLLAQQQQQFRQSAMQGMGQMQGQHQMQFSSQLGHQQFQSRQPLSSVHMQHGLGQTQLNQGN